jgi:protein-tyrosine phosphatase
MLDLHCHILPGYDDGAVDLQESMAMMRDAREQGCRAVIATSHLWENLFDTSPQMLRREYEALLRVVERERIPLEILPGAENFVGDVAPDKFAENAVPLGENGRYALLDFSLRAVPRHLPQVIDALRDRGLVSVIAHPERNLELQADPSPIAEWIEKGARIQVNAGSLIGYLGEGARKTGEYLVECGAAHLLASDAHDCRRRPFCLEHGRRAAAKIVSEEAANRIAKENPWKIAHGETIVVPPVQIESPSGPRRLLRRILARRR